MNIYNTFKIIQENFRTEHGRDIQVIIIFFKQEIFNIGITSQRHLWTCRYLIRTTYQILYVTLFFFLFYNWSFNEYSIAWFLFVYETNLLKFVSKIKKQANLHVQTFLSPFKNLSPTSHITFHISFISHFCYLLFVTKRQSKTLLDFF